MNHGNDFEHDRGMKELIHALTALAKKTVELFSEGIKWIRGDGRHDRNLNVFVSEIQGNRSSNMVNKFTVPPLLDVNSIVLSAMPRKGGEIDTAAVVQWDKTGDIGLEAMEAFDFDDSPNKDGSKIVHCPASFRIRVTTPGTSGTGTVTATAPGYDKSASEPISYAPGADRNLNVGVGDPELDPEG